MKKLISITGQSYERGKQRGQHLKKIIQAKVERTMAYLTKYFSEMVIQSTALAFEQKIKASYPEIMEEMEGIANGAEIDFEVFRNAAIGRPAASFSHTKSAGENQNEEECSCFALRQQIGGQDVFLAKNADLATEGDPLADDLTVLLVQPKEGFQYLCYTGFPEWPGGTEGINEHGLAMVGSGVSTNDVPDQWMQNTKVGVPLHLLQSVLFRTCRTIEEALDHIRHSPRGFLGRNLLITDRTGGWAKCEVSFNHLEIDRGEDRTYLIGTSHFRSEKLKSLSPSRVEYPSSYLRYEQLESLLSEVKGELEPKDARMILADHYNGPSNKSICRHSNVSNTFGSIFIHDSPPTLHALFGRPCRQKFVAYSLPALKESFA